MTALSKTKGLAQGGRSAFDVKHSFKIGRSFSGFVIHMSEYGFAPQGDLSLMASLQLLPHVAYIEPDQMVQLSLPPFTLDSPDMSPSSTATSPQQQSAASLGDLFPDDLEKGHIVGVSGPFVFPNDNTSDVDSIPMESPAPPPPPSLSPPPPAVALPNFSQTREEGDSLDTSPSTEERRVYDAEEKQARRQNEQRTKANHDDPGVQSSATWNLVRINHHSLASSMNTTQFEYGLQAGQEVDIYIVDTGVLVTHDEFENGRAIWGVDLSGTNAATDDNGHGTHVAALAAGKQYGIAKNATVVSVKVLDAMAQGSYSNIIAGVNWVVDRAKAQARKSIAKYHFVLYARTLLWRIFFLHDEVTG